MRLAARRRHVRGLFRAFAYLATVGIVFALLSVRSARAEIEQNTVAIGRQMAALARATNHEVTPILFNGQPMFLASSVTDDAPAAVLDRYAEHCKAQQVPDARSSVLRGGDALEGTTVCFVRGASTNASLPDAFRSFAETGELGYLGKLRYAYARKDGRYGRTLVLTVWTEDQFNLGDLLPTEDKDVPGADFPELPRPPDATRSLSAFAKGAPYGVNVYKTAESTAKVVAFYDTLMHERGFTAYDPELDEAKVGAVGRTYTKDGVVLTVAARRETSGTFVALGLAGASPDAPGAEEGR
jgi:hypothetical protein